MHEIELCEGRMYEELVKNPRGTYKEHVVEDV